MLLAVILESRHDNKDLCITPSPFYIEEIQDTFEHLKSGGIENLANTWMSANKRPQVFYYFIYNILCKAYMHN